MQSPRLSEARFTMRWAYLILVSCPSRREARGIVDPSLQRRDEPSFFVPPFPLQVAVPEDAEADPNPTLHGHPECRDRAYRRYAIAMRPINAARRQRPKAVRDLKRSPRTSGRSAPSLGPRGFARSSSEA